MHHNTKKTLADRIKGNKVHTSIMGRNTMLLPEGNNIKIYKFRMLEIKVLLFIDIMTMIQYESER